MRINNARRQHTYTHTHTKNYTIKLSACNGISAHRYTHFDTGGRQIIGKFNLTPLQYTLYSTIVDEWIFWGLWFIVRTKRDHPATLSRLLSLGVQVRAQEPEHMSAENAVSYRPYNCSCRSNYYVIINHRVRNFADDHHDARCAIMTGEIRERLLLVCEILIAPIITHVVCIM